MTMRSDIDVALDLMEAARTKIRQLIVMAGEYQGVEAVHAQVDLGHAEHRIKEAVHYVNRLVVNGKKPWDQVNA